MIRVDGPIAARRALRHIGQVLHLATPNEVTKQGAAFAFLVGLKMADRHPVWARAVLRWLPNKAGEELVDQFHEELELRLDKVGDEDKNGDRS